MLTLFGFRGYGSHSSQPYDSSGSSSAYGGSYSAPPYPHHSNYYSWGGYYHYSHNYQNHPPPAHEYLVSARPGWQKEAGVGEE